MGTFAWGRRRWSCSSCSPSSQLSLRTTQTTSSTMDSAGLARATRRTSGACIVTTSPGWMHFKIQRHPDHHVNAGRPYQILRTFKDSPAYPTGYAGMIALSWFPPLFFAVMNPLVKKAQEDYKLQVQIGSYETLFPKGVNNISSVYQPVGADFFEKGSSEYCGGIDSMQGAVQSPSDPVKCQAVESASKKER